MNTPVTIWHNPKCSKSRATAQLLEERGIEAEVIKYLETPPTEETLKEVLQMLDIPARELMRTKEPLYTTLNLQDVRSEEALIAAMAAHPKLIERPIVIRGEKAAIGRPLEKIITLLETPA